MPGVPVCRALNPVAAALTPPVIWLILTPGPPQPLGERFPKWGVQRAEPLSLPKGPGV